MYKWIIDVCLESGYAEDAARDIALCSIGLIIIGVCFLVIKIKEWFGK